MSVAAEGGTEGGAYSVFSDAVFALRNNPCAVRRVVALRSDLLAPAEEAKLARLDGLAQALCAADVPRLDADWGADGDVVLQPSAAGVAARNGSVFLFDGFTPWTERGRTRASDETLPACGGTVSATPLTYFPVEDVAATLRLDAPPSVFLWVRAPGGENTCVTSELGPRSVSLMPGAATQVWVGAEEEGLEWELVAESFNLNSTFARVWTFGAGFEMDLELGPYTLDAATSTGVLGDNYCSGYTAEEPTVRVHVPRAGFGAIMVESDGDPVLVVHGPNDEVFCNDDYSGLNPGVDAWFEPGDWDVWVGTFGPSVSLPAQVRFE